MSQNVVFDEASSWWSPQATLLPDSKEIEEQKQKRKKIEVPKDKEIQPTQEEIAEGEPSLRPGKSISPDKEKSPWQIGAHIRSPEEERLS